MRRQCVEPFETPITWEYFEKHSGRAANSEPKVPTPDHTEAVGSGVSFRDTFFTILYCTLKNHL